jgi:DNA primase
MLDPQRRAQLDSNIKQMLARGASQQDVINYANDFKNKFSVSNQQTTQQQAPIQQTTVTPQQEEPGFFEGVKNFLFGDEEKKPKAELISEKFEEPNLKPETPYPFTKTTPITVLDKEYEQKIKAVEDKYSKLQEDPSNYATYVPSRFAIFGAEPVVKTYKVDYTGQKEQEILNLKAEKLRREGRNLTPIEQEQDIINYKNKMLLCQVRRTKFLNIIIILSILIYFC